MKYYTTFLTFLAATTLVVFSSTSVEAQPRLGGGAEVSVNGSTITVSVEIQAEGAPYGLGPSTLQFTYDDAAYSLNPSPETPADYLYDPRWSTLAIGVELYTNTITRPAANIASINVFFNPVEGGASFVPEVDAIARKLVDITFTALSPAALANVSAADFTWTRCEHSSDTLVAGVAEFAIDDCSAFENFSDLPVELAGLNVTTQERSASITWTTASELNNAGFAVEYARVGEDFTEAGYVEGAGTTEEANDYSFDLNEILPGKYQFRLKQVDFDGQFEYSPIIEAEVSIPGEFMLDNAYPNPFNPQTTINFAVAEEQEVRFDLYDATGRMVRTLFHGTVDSNEAQTLRVDGSDLTSGVYIGVLVGKTFKASQRLVLIK